MKQVNTPHVRGSTRPSEQTFRTEQPFKTLIRHQLSPQVVK